MVRAKRATVFPLCVASAIASTNGEPSVPAHRFARAGVGLLEPRNYQRCFRLELTVGDVVVRQRTVKWVQLRNKCHRNVISPRAGLGIIISAIIRRPIKVPSTFVIWDGIITSCLFSNPKYRGDNIGLPRVTLHCRTRAGRNKNLRLHFEQCLLPKFHCGTSRSRPPWHKGKRIVRRL